MDKSKVDERRRNLLKWGAYGTTLAALDAATAGCAFAGNQSAVVGLTAAGVAKIKRVFERMIADDLHPGAQLAVYRHGKLALALAGGVTEPDGKTPVTAKTLYQIRSTTKALTTLAMMQAYERGRFKFEEPVAKHWPEFAAKGKDKITIAQVLSHRAGIPDGPMIPAEKLGDRQAVAAAVAAMKPVWEPGSKNGYHASTIGWVSDELLWRWEGKPAHMLLQRDYFTPLGLSDLYVGLPREQYSRMAKMDVSPEVRKEQELRARLSDFINTPEGISLPMSWISGVATATDLGRLMNVLAYEGAFENRKYFKPETQALMSRPTNAEGEMDQRLMASVRWGLGFLLGVERSSFSTAPHPRAVGHSGGGASVAWADPEQKLAVAFLCNRMLGTGSGKRTRAIGDAIYEALA